MEIWKDIPGYEGMYQVSSLGRVKSLPRQVWSPNNHTYMNWPGRILKPGKQGRRVKYLGVSLCKNGTAKRFLVHRLVAVAFLPNPDNLPWINHKDLNGLNNCVDNLEWCDPPYNNSYADRVERARETLKVVMRGKTYPQRSAEARHNISEGAKRGWIKRKGGYL